MKRTISVALLPDLLECGDSISRSCAIVIDVLRATSVMATAGAAGAARIHTCQETDQTRQMAERISPRPLLCGERECKPIPGFDLGNSPAEYDQETVAGRELILTTTNGTRAINVVRSARRTLCASFLNLSATVDAVAVEDDLQIICAGTNRRVTYEDVLLAGAMIQRLSQSDAWVLHNDSARIALSCWNDVDQGDADLIKALRHSLGGRNLIAAGYAEDISRCAAIDRVAGVVERTGAEEATFEFRKA